MVRAPRPPLKGMLVLLILLTLPNVHGRADQQESTTAGQIGAIAVEMPQEEGSEKVQKEETRTVQTGVLKVSVSSSGASSDHIYSVFLDGEQQPSIGRETPLTFEPAIGEHEVRLDGFSNKCKVAENPRTVIVAPEETTTVVFVVTCGGPSLWNQLGEGKALFIIEKVVGEMKLNSLLAHKFDSADSKRFAYSQEFKELICYLTNGCGVKVWRTSDGVRFRKGAESTELVAEAFFTGTDRKGKLGPTLYVLSKDHEELMTIKGLPLQNLFPWQDPKEGQLEKELLEPVMKKLRFTQDEFDEFINLLKNTLRSQSLDPDTEDKLVSSIEKLRDVVVRSP